MFQSVFHFDFYFRKTVFTEMEMSRFMELTDFFEMGERGNRRFAKFCSKDLVTQLGLGLRF